MKYVRNLYFIWQCIKGGLLGWKVYTELLSSHVTSRYECGFRVKAYSAMVTSSLRV